MNDSPYGLTASIWTASEAAFLDLVDDLETGTAYMNRCDYLDPALAWTGVKASGRGVSLSSFGEFHLLFMDGHVLQAALNWVGKTGYDQLTRAKSVNMKIVTA